jgi:hypothetical protein
MDGIVGRQCVDSRHFIVTRYVVSKSSMLMWGVAIDAEHAAMYLASEVDMAIGVGMVELALMREPL